MSRIFRKLRGNAPGKTAYNVQILPRRNKNASGRKVAVRVTGESLHVWVRITNTRHMQVQHAKRLTITCTRCGEQVARV
jgi:predicted nucleic-acid-binding Zn-ribbon protein